MIVRNAKITSDFGVTRNLPDGRISVHDGIDYKSATNDRTVYSLCDGKVVYDFDDYCEKCNNYETCRIAYSVCTLLNEIYMI